MADLKISQMNAASSVNAADVVPIVQSGANFKATVSQLSRIAPMTPSAKSALFTAAWNTYYTCSGTSYTITLPTAVGNSGAIIGFYCTASGTLTLDGNSSETVGGRTTLALIAGDFIEVISDGTNVQIVNFTHGDWASYTPTINAVTTNPTKGASRLELCLYKRDGHDMLIQFLYRQTSAGAAGSGTYLFVLPISVSTDGTFVQTGVATSASTVGSLLGTGQAITVSGNVVGSVGVYAYDSTNLRLSGIYDGSGAGGGQVGSGFFAMSLTDVDYMFTVRVPISGW